MIFDSINNLEKYKNIPYLDIILEFIKNSNLAELPTGDILIKDDALFVKVLRYNPKNASENYFEIHNFHADLQLIVSGIEAFHIVNNCYLEETNEFKMEGDFAFYKADKNITELVLEPGKFAFLFPEEPHKPGCKYKSIESPILKLVFKIKID